MDASRGRWKNKQEDYQVGMLAVSRQKYAERGTAINEAENIGRKGQMNRAEFEPSQKTL